MERRYVSDNVHGLEIYDFLKPYAGELIVAHPPPVFVCLKAKEKPSSIENLFFERYVNLKTLAYIASSSFSGSTLLSFLLNCHPNIFTAGEMNGWNYGLDEVFHCSCAKTIGECTFFKFIAKRFKENGLHFETRRFGTEYQIVSSERFNRYLTKTLPFGLPSSRLETVRDRFISAIPLFKKRLIEIDRANQVFIDAALTFSKKDIFIDACKDPHRMRLLQRIGNLNIKPIHLVRDFRGVALSNRKNKGWQLSFSMKMWIFQQEVIDRISNEFKENIRIHYEDLCASLTDVMDNIFQFIGVEAFQLPENFKDAEHHILGNAMRLSGMSHVTDLAKWKKELQVDEIDLLNQMAEKYLLKKKNMTVVKILEKYLAVS